MYFIHDIYSVLLNLHDYNCCVDAGTAVGSGDDSRLSVGRVLFVHIFALVSSVSRVYFYFYSFNFIN